MGQKNNVGKFISLILRHHPENIDIKLDEHGCARTEDLIAGIAKSRPFDMQMLEEIVRTDSKQRYSFNEDKTLIRQTRGIPFRWMWNWSKRTHRMFYGMEQERSMWNPSIRLD